MKAELKVFEKVFEKIFVGDKNEINDTYRKSHRIERVTVLDSFSHTLGLARKRTAQYRGWQRCGYTKMKTLSMNV